MKVIFKYQTNAETPVVVPVGMVVSIGADPARADLDPVLRQRDMPCVWIMHEQAADGSIAPQEGVQNMELAVVGTGHNFEGSWHPVGTWVNTPFAWHVLTKLSFI